MYTIDKVTYRTKSAYKQQAGRSITFLVLHYTAGGFKPSASILTNGNVSAHYLVPAVHEKSYIDSGFNTQKIFNLVDESNVAWHAGISSWRGVKFLNNNSIGIENVNLASVVNNVYQFPPYEDEQIQALIYLCKDILSRNKNIPPRNVVAHSDISPGRKSDPGPKFPWDLLYKNGIGAWYDVSAYQNYQAQFSSKLPTQSQFLNKLSKYGYDINGGAGPKDLIRAFQLHFMPSSNFGVLDVNTAAALYALTDKYS